MGRKDGEIVTKIQLHRAAEKGQFEEGQHPFYKNRSCFLPKRSYLLKSDPGGLAGGANDPTGGAVFLKN